MLLLIPIKYNFQEISIWQSRALSCYHLDVEENCVFKDGKVCTALKTFPLLVLFNVIAQKWNKNFFSYSRISHIKYIFVFLFLTFFETTFEFQVCHLMCVVGICIGFECAYTYMTKMMYHYTNNSCMQAAYLSVPKGDWFERT